MGQATASYGSVFPWEHSKLPNLPDFDVAVLDLRSLARNAGGMTMGSFPEFGKLVARLLQSGGEVIVIASDLAMSVQVRHHPAGGQMQSVPIASIVGAPVNDVSESGTSLLRTGSTRFSKYLGYVTRWIFHFSFAGSPTECFLKNREDRWLAGQVTVGKTGRLVVLPAGDFGEHPEKAIDLVLEEVCGTAPATPPPAWSDKVEIPGIAELDRKTGAAHAQIARLSDEVAAISRQREALLQYRKLVYAEGKELEDVIKEALLLLGGAVVPPKYGTEEYILVHQETEHLIEVKGVTGSAALKHVRQLMDNQLVPEEKTGNSLHGILIVNAFRSEPPEARGIGQLVEFPPNVITRATANNIALVTGTSFLNAVCSKLGGSTDGSQFLNRVASTAGVVGE